MQDAYSTNTKDVIACIGPSIGPRDYVITSEIVAELRGKLVSSDDLHLLDDRSAFLDLWCANARLLQRNGIDQVEVGALSTKSLSCLFYSERMTRPTGRFASTVLIR